MIRNTAAFVIAFCVCGFPAVAQIVGSCVGGFNWSAYLINQGGGAAAYYNECSPSADYVSLSCAPSSSDITLSVEVPVQAQGPVAAQWVVDGRAFALQGQANFSELLGGAMTEFRIARNAPVLQALSSGSRAELVIADVSIPMHLSGSSGAIGGLIDGCWP